jgi:hypothetical protein
MSRDVEKAKSADTGKRRSPDKGGDIHSKEKHECKESKRGWRDVLDNLEYSEGPGDNIYVFG